MSGPLYWMIVAAGMGFMGMYQLTESRHAEILQVLRERRSASGGKVPVEDKIK